MGSFSVNAQTHRRHETIACLATVLVHIASTTENIPDTSWLQFFAMTQVDQSGTHLVPADPVAIRQVTAIISSH